MNSESYFLNSESYFLHAGHAAPMNAQQNFELWQHRRGEHVARFAEFRRKKLDITQNLRKFDRMKHIERVYAGTIETVELAAWRQQMQRDGFTALWTWICWVIRRHCMAEARQHEE